MNKRSLSVIAAVMVVIMFAGVAEGAALGDKLLYQGSRGNDVAELQQVLNGWGISSGPVDGIFGPKTRSAVVNFQRRNGLLVDGIVGPQTVGEIHKIQKLDAKKEAGRQEEQPITAEPVLTRGNYSQAGIDVLARLVRSEAGGESYTGKVAVAASVLNRVDSSSYPDSIRSVVYQVVDGHYQYSPVLDGRINIQACSEDYDAVYDALKGWDPSYGALGFYNPAKTSNWWVRSQPVTTQIGNHVFFK